MPRRSEVISLKPEQYFQPFAGKRLDTNKVVPGQWDDLVTRRIRFNGIRGGAVLFYDLLSDHEVGNFPYTFYMDKLVTPLGDVRFSAVYREGEEVRYQDLPLRLSLDFWPRTIKAYRELRQHRAEVDFTGQVLYLDCVPNSDSPQITEGIITDGYKEWLSSEDFYTPEGEARTVLLPSNIDRLAQIKMRFVVKERP
ncbi:hypothetical protein HYW41_01235 [Candidatus Daviesbacteria bacterium]|nr:hypothetical protein [Candidatus Daviesbacteria bacterium]